jgi:hypothetical protein
MIIFHAVTYPVMHIGPSHCGKPSLGITNIRPFLNCLKQGTIILFIMFFSTFVPRQVSTAGLEDWKSSLQFPKCLFFIIYFFPKNKSRKENGSCTPTFHHVIHVHGPAAPLPTRPKKSVVDPPKWGFCARVFPTIPCTLFDHWIGPCWIRTSLMRDRIYADYRVLPRMSIKLQG